jgi:hypothetical protein
MNSETVPGRCGVIVMNTTLSMERKEASEARRLCVYCGNQRQEDADWLSAKYLKSSQYSAD